MNRRPWLWLLPLALLVVFWPRGGLGDYLRLLGAQSAPVMIGALAMTLIGAMRGVDLSVGAVMLLCGAVVSLGEWGIAAALGVGIGLGLISAPLSRRLGAEWPVMTFAAGLGWMALVQQLPAGGAVPGWLRHLMDPTGWTGATAFWIALGLALVLGLLIRYTVWGRHLLAAGANEEAAQFCGVRTRQVRLAAFAIAGALLAVAGALAYGGRGEIDPSLAPGLTLELLAATLLGGGTFLGGRASMGGAVAGALMVVLVRHAVVLWGGERAVADLLLALLVAGLWLKRRAESVKEG